MCEKYKELETCISPFQAILRDCSSCHMILNGYLSANETETCLPLPDPDHKPLTRSTSSLPCQGVERRNLVLGGLFCQLLSRRVFSPWTLDQGMLGCLES